MPKLEANAIVESALETLREGIFVLPGRRDESVPGHVHESVRMDPHASDVEGRRGAVKAHSQVVVFQNHDLLTVVRVCNDRSGRE